MKILSVSDQVEKSFYDSRDDERFDGVGLILSCGDLPPEYLTYLHGRIDVPLLYVKGNHDLRYASKPPNGCLNAHQRIIRFKGLKILGLDGSRWYNGGPNQYTEQEMRFKVWGLMPRIWWEGGLDVVITHAPPRYIHDAEDRCHRGFKVYRRLIDRYRPKLFIHGHIHARFEEPGDRETMVGQTRVINTYGYNLIELADENAD
jgi:uncharacterized protein